MRPTVEGTKALLPGISLLIVHLRFVPGGHIQCVRQLMDKSSIGRFGISSNLLSFIFLRCLFFLFSSHDFC